MQIKLWCATISLALFSWWLLPSQAQAPGDTSGNWHGTWTAPEGWNYQAAMKLAVSHDQVQGEIHWTLKASPRPSDQSKIGLTGIELVKGTFVPSCGVVLMEGVSLDDPNHILGVDKYRLILSDDGRVLGGITWHRGAWTAQFLLQR